MSSTGLWDWMREEQHILAQRLAVAASSSAGDGLIAGADQRVVNRGPKAQSERTLARATGEQASSSARSGKATRRGRGSRARAA